MPRVSLSALALMALASTTAAQSTTLLDRGFDGQPADTNGGDPAISADGRFAAFVTRASGIVPGDFNQKDDIFLVELATGAVEPITISHLGKPSDGDSSSPHISGDGRFVVFNSRATNLVPASERGNSGIYIRDRSLEQTTELEIPTISGAQPDGYTVINAISFTGRFLIIGSDAQNLLFDDNNGATDSFIFDLNTGLLERVSVGSGGVEADEGGSGGSVSADGRWVSFSSSASNLAAVKTVPGANDIYLRDRLTDTTTLLSASAPGVTGNSLSFGSMVSADGSTVVFESASSDLIQGDVKGQIDVFAFDISTGVLSRVSQKRNGQGGAVKSSGSVVSADGRFVAFSTRSDNLIPGGLNGRTQILIADRELGTFEVASRSYSGELANDDCGRAGVSADARQVCFQSSADNMVPGGTQSHLRHVFVRDQPNVLEENTVALASDYSASVGSVLQFEWVNAPADGSYYLFYSQNVQGSVVQGHQFDLGAPATLLANGANELDGSGQFVTAPIPAIAAGRTLYFELAFLSANGVEIDDSTVQAVVIQ